MISCFDVDNLKSIVHSVYFGICVYLSNQICVQVFHISIDIRDVEMCNFLQGNVAKMVKEKCSVFLKLKVKFIWFLG